MFFLKIIVYINLGVRPTRQTVFEGVWLQSMARRALLACSDAPYLVRQEPTVAEGDIAAEPVCGWRNVDPSAQYICKESSRKQKTLESPSFMRRRDQGTSDQQFAYMSGRVNDDFSYVYTSRPVESGVFAKQQIWKQPHPSAVLEPVKPTKITDESRALCRDFAKIVSIQLHQDVFLEQARVQQQLQAAQSAPLGLEGVGLSVKPPFTRSSSDMQTGTLHSSSLPEPIHKVKAKPQGAQRPLGCWFPFGRGDQIGPLVYPQDLLIVKSQRSFAKKNSRVRGWKDKR